MKYWKRKKIYLCTLTVSVDKNPDKLPDPY